MKAGLAPNQPPENWIAKEAASLHYRFVFRARWGIAHVANGLFGRLDLGGSGYDHL